MNPWDLINHVPPVTHSWSLPHPCALIPLQRDMCLGESDCVMPSLKKAALGYAKRPDSAIQELVTYIFNEWLSRMNFEVFVCSMPLLSSTKSCSTQPERSC